MFVLFYGDKEVDNLQPSPLDSYSLRFDSISIWFRFDYVNVF